MACLPCETLLLPVPGPSCVGRRLTALHGTAEQLLSGDGGAPCRRESPASIPLRHGQSWQAVAAQADPASAASASPRAPVQHVVMGWSAADQRLGAEVNHLLGGRQQDAACREGRADGQVASSLTLTAHRAATSRGVGELACPGLSAAAGARGGAVRVQQGSTYCAHACVIHPRAAGPAGAAAAQHRVAPCAPDLCGSRKRPGRQERDQAEVHSQWSSRWKIATRSPTLQPPALQALMIRA